MKDIKDGRSISREVLEEYRFRALELKDKHWKVNKIAEAFGLHRVQFLIGSQLTAEKVKRD